MNRLSTPCLLLWAAVIAGCAASYSPISQLDSIADAEVSNGDLRAIVGIQPLGDNSRFKDTAEESEVAILKLTVENLSPHPIMIKASDIFLEDTARGRPVSQLPTAYVAKQMSLATATYWLWGLLWMGYTETTNKESSSLWLPVGLPIGAINFFRARSTNASFEEEITQNAFPDTKLQPNERKGGMLFFHKTSGIRFNLVVMYTDGANEKQRIVIPWKL